LGYSDSKSIKIPATVAKNCESQKVTTSGDPAVAVPLLPLLMVALSAVACEPLCMATGKVMTADGAQGVKCSVELVRPGEPSMATAPCREPLSVEDSPDYWIVRSGMDFQCATIPGIAGQQLGVRVACEGYELGRTEPFAWKVERMTCRSVDLGTITVMRVPRPSHTASPPPP
jgi:hypothetical protein